MIGHDEQVAAFKAPFMGDRPQHSWLLVGPEGLGKALFARQAAVWLLAGCPDVPGLAVPDDDRAARLMAAGSHLDYRLVAREESSTTGKLRSEIVLPQIVRRKETVGQPLREFLQGTALLGKRRVVVVDAADDMNKNVANALLKNLEEPGEDTIFLLISHSPGRLLPTIRSRCRILRFHPLPDAQVASLLDDVDDDDDRAALISLAQGCPGRALRFAEPGIGALFDDMAALASTGAKPGAALRLAKSLAGKAGAGRYEAFLERAPAMLAQAARQQRGPALGAALADWEAASKLAADALPLNLVAEQVVFDLAMKLAAIGAR